MFQQEENDIWRKDRSEVKGIFRREVSEHNAPCSDEAAVIIDDIFLLEIGLLSYFVG